MKRDLNSVLLEARKVQIKDEAEVIKCVETLGKRKLVSIIESKKGVKAKIRDPHTASLLKVVTRYFKDLCDLNNEEVVNGLINISFLDYMCLLDHALMFDCEEIRTDFSSINFSTLTQLLIMEFLEKAKAMGDIDVCNLVRVNKHMLYSLIDDKTPDEEELAKSSMLGPYFSNVVNYGFMRICQDYDIKKAIANFRQFATAATNEARTAN